MADTRRVFDEGGKSIIANIIANQKKRKFRASGKSAKSLQYVATDDKVTISGASYFLFQERGASPWKNKGRPPGWFVKVISNWLKVKGLKIPAWAVAHSIVNRGNKLHRREREPLGIEEIADKEAERIATEIAESLAGDISVDVQLHI